MNVNASESVGLVIWCFAFPNEQNGYAWKEVGQTFPSRASLRKENSRCCETSASLTTYWVAEKTPGMYKIGDKKRSKRHILGFTPSDNAFCFLKDVSTFRMPI
jgi:hypothetical protein